MKKTLVRKILSNIIFAVIFSALLGIVILKSYYYFTNILSIFSIIYLLIGWLNYLKLDGLIFHLNKEKIKEIENDEYVSLSITPDMYSNLIIKSYIISGAILILLSLLIYRN